jgi:hypothetical protein
MTIKEKHKDGETHQHQGVVHTHDHWHVTHVHNGSGPNDFEHRSTYHTHEHNHAGYEYHADKPKEHMEESHSAKAHIHDHSAPVEEAR